MMRRNRAWSLSILFVFWSQLKRIIHLRTFRKLYRAATELSLTQYFAWFISNISNVGRNDAMTKLDLTYRHNAVKSRKKGNIFHIFLSTTFWSHFINIHQFSSHGSHQVLLIPWKGQMVFLYNFIFEAWFKWVNWSKSNIFHLFILWLFKFFINASATLSDSLKIDFWVWETVHKFSFIEKANDGRRTKKMANPFAKKPHQSIK